MSIYRRYAEQHPDCHADPFYPLADSATTAVTRLVNPGTYSNPNVHPITPYSLSICHTQPDRTVPDLDDLCTMADDTAPELDGQLPVGPLLNG